MDCQRALFVWHNIFVTEAFTVTYGKMSQQKSSSNGSILWHNVAKQNWWIPVVFHIEKKVSLVDGFMVHDYEWSNAVLGAFGQGMSMTTR